MRKRNLIWTHSKYPARKYSASYGTESRSGERAFILTAVLKSGKKHNLAFESHEAAKQAGWSRRKHR